jgi:drug/metabolite transporter (DMT)-like permease
MARSNERLRSSRAACGAGRKAMAYLLFDETLTAVQIAGMALCGAAVFLVTRSRE